MSTRIEGERGAAEAYMPLIAHIVHRLDVGGLENGVINLVNRMSRDHYRHAIISLTECGEFRYRIRRPNVPIYALHKRPGQDPPVYFRLYRLLRQLRPALVHTRGVSTLECQLPAAVAGVGARIHGEHGWDVSGPGAVRMWHHRLRRLCRPLVSHYVALSHEIEQYLRDWIRVPAERITKIYNGVDAECFAPGTREGVLPAGFMPPSAMVVGTVGRMKDVKDPLTLVRAFLELLRTVPDARQRLRLVLVGDGPLRTTAARMLAEGNALDVSWLPGTRDDVPGLLRTFDVFVLPSRAEGLSNTVLEAMASALPVVATRVGGNTEVVVPGETGCLVPPEDAARMAQAIRRYLDHPDLRVLHGETGRRRAQRVFGIDTMVAAYVSLYDGVLAAK